MRPLKQKPQRHGQIIMAQSTFRHPLPKPLFDSRTDLSMFREGLTETKGLDVSFPLTFGSANRKEESHNVVFTVEQEEKQGKERRIR